jgi:hypothetical protein
MNNHHYTCTDGRNKNRSCEKLADVWIFAGENIVNVDDLTATREDSVWQVESRKRGIGFRIRITDSPRGGRAGGGGGRWEARWRRRFCAKASAKVFSG